MYIETINSGRVFVKDNDLLMLDGCRESYRITLNDKDECGPLATISERNGGFGEQIYLKTTKEKFKVFNR